MLPLLLFTVKEFILIFVLLEILLLSLMKDKIFSFFKILFVTSFIALFIIHNPRFYLWEISWSFINQYWIRTLYLFLFVSWLTLTIGISNTVSFMKDLKIKREFIFLITTTLIILRRIPNKLEQIYDVQKARKLIRNGLINRLLDYPKIIVPLIITLLREIDFIVFNYYVLDEYELKAPQIKNRFVANYVVTIFCILSIIGLLTANI